MHRFLLVLFICSTFLFARNGKIVGIVSDKTDADEVLIGVNISLIGTYKGASTDADGYFVITNVAPGQYTLEASFIGYKVVRKTGVTVGEDETVTVNFELEPTTLALGQEIEVIGKRELMNIEETSTSRSLTSEDIQGRVVDDIGDLVTQQVSVVKQDDAIHIRGGRAYEVQYLVDGISVQDPLSGTGFGLNVSANAINEVEVITGGFSAEYGQATSGVVKVKTKSGGDKMEGYFSYKSDHMGLFKDQDFSFNGDQYEFSLGGPEPLSNNVFPFIGLNLPGNLYFFTNVYSSLSDDYTRANAPELYSSIAPRLNFFGDNLLNPTSLAPRQNNNWSFLFKLTWKLNPTNTFTWSYNRSLSINQNTQTLQTNLEYVEPSPGFPYEFSRNLANFNTYSHDNEKVSLNWQHTLNKTTYSELSLSRFFTHLRSDWQGVLWDQYAPPFDAARLPVEYFYPDDQTIRVIPGDGLYDYGNAFVWHDHHVDNYAIKGSIVSKLETSQTLTGGFEANFRELQLMDIADPWVGGFGSSQDIYRVHPADGAFFLQDEMKLNGFILNAGVRLDWWAPGEFADRSIEQDNHLTEEARKKYIDESFDIFGRRVKLRLMPRMGVSFPISDNQMFYFNYGHFSKRPRPQFVYAKLSTSSSKSSSQKYGNPSLNPETSVIYEMGVRHKFGQDNVLSATAFYKDIFDYVQSISGTLPRVGSGIFYVNQDYAKSRGIELEYKTRFAQYFYGTMSGTWSLTTTKSSNSDIAALIEGGEINEPPVKEIVARWDRPWQFTTNLSIRVGKDEHPSLFGLRLFDNWNAGFFFFAQAGKRYTPQTLFGYDPSGRPLYASVEDQTESYSKVGSMWKWVDFSFSKYFNLYGLRYSFSIEIKNLFNDKNAQIINPVTGRAYSYGDRVPSSWNDPMYPDLQAPISSPFPFNPARYKAPRNIRFGLSVEF